MSASAPDQEGAHAVSDHDRRFGFHTRALHAGQRPDPATGARAVPIYRDGGTQ